MAALVWLIIGLVLVAAEVLSGDFVLLMLGSAALAAAGAAVVFSPFWVSATVFALVALGLVTVARPALKRRLHAGSAIAMHTEALVGARAVTLTTVDTHDGRVKLSGEEWSARSFTDQPIPPGTTVTVIEISGATAVVLAEG
jgi:membrane protein implicated in regulation of membrane protease activity